MPTKATPTTRKETDEAEVLSGSFVSSGRGIYRATRIGADSYAASLAAHRETWSRACRRCGAAFVPLTAESLFENGRIPALERAGVLEGA